MNDMTRRGFLAKLGLGAGCAGLAVGGALKLIPGAQDSSVDGEITLDMTKDQFQGPDTIFLQPGGYTQISAFAPGFKGQRAEGWVEDDPVVEDWADLIQNVDPSKTPLLEMVAKDPRDVEHAEKATKLANWVLENETSRDEYNRIITAAMQDLSSQMDTRIKADIVGGPWFGVNNV